MNQIFFNCTVVTLFDEKRKKVRLKPSHGQTVPELFIRCSRKQREKLLLGTTLIIDLKLIQPKNKKPYLLARNPFALNQLSLF